MDMISIKLMAMIVTLSAFIMANWLIVNAILAKRKNISYMEYTDQQMKDTRIPLAFGIIAFIAGLYYIFILLIREIFV